MLAALFTTIQKFRCGSSSSRRSSLLSPNSIGLWTSSSSDVASAISNSVPRERDHEYQLEHANDRWIVRTNWQAKNFRIVEVPKGAEADRSRWRDIYNANRDQMPSQNALRIGMQVKIP